MQIRCFNCGYEFSYIRLEDSSTTKLFYTDYDKYSLGYISDITYIVEDFFYLVCMRKDEYLFSFVVDSVVDGLKLYEEELITICKVDVKNIKPGTKYNPYYFEKYKVLEYDGKFTNYLVDEHVLKSFEGIKKFDL